MSEKIKEKWRLKRVIKEIVITLLLFFVISVVINFIRQPKINDTIYNYELVDIKENKINFYEYEGEPLIVHFWATWCPTCKLEASNIEELSNYYNVITIAVNSGENQEIETFMKKNGLTYRVINDKKGALAQKFNISAYPTTLIYNAKRELKFTEVGYSTTIGLEARVRLIN